MLHTEEDALISLCIAWLLLKVFDAQQKNKGQLRMSNKQLKNRCGLNGLFGCIKEALISYSRRVRTVED